MMMILFVDYIRSGIYLTSRAWQRCINNANRGKPLLNPLLVSNKYYITANQGLASPSKSNIESIKTVQSVIEQTINIHSPIGGIRGGQGGATAPSMFTE